MRWNPTRRVAGPSEGRDIVSGLLLAGSRASVSANDAIRSYRESRRALPESVWRFYNQRARAENIIKEGGEDLALDHVVSRSLAGNRMWMLLSLLAYNLTNWFREKALNQHAHKTMASGLRKTLIELPAQLLYHARQWRPKIWRDHPSRAAYERADRRLATLPL